jgi:hypothetical protein
VVSYSIQTNPVAAFDGTNYFVVWQDSQPGTTTWDIMGARVTPTGEVLDVPPVRISSVADFQWVPAVAYGGTEYFVTWQDRRFGTSSGWTIYGARVTTSGTLLDTAGILIRRRQGYNIVTPSVAFDGVNFLVLWNQGWTYARFINQAGQFLDSTPFPVNSGEYEKRTPRAVYGADCYMVAWSERSQYNDLSIGTMRLSRFGEQLDTGVVLISASGMLRPSVAWDSVNFLVAWQYGNNSILAGRVAGVGGILPPQSYPVCTGPGQVSYPSVTFDGEDFLAAWQDKRNNNWDIYGAKMNRALTECDTFRICARSKDQTVPVLSSGPGGQVLAAFAGGIDSVGGNPASGQRVWGKLFSKPGPMPPAMLWPPAGYRFFGPPVWFLADTALRGVDSFGFRVFVPDGDTIWSQPTAVPGCTIPDTILTNDSSYRWQCRVRTGYGWSRYSTARQFWVEFGHVAAPEPLSGHRVLALSVRSVSSRESRSVTFRPYGATDGAAIELLDAAGRRVRRIQVNHDGALLWDMKDATGRRVGAGVYFARLTTGRQVLTRRVVLVN